MMQLAPANCGDRRGTPPHYAQVEQTGGERQSIGPQKPGEEVLLLIKGKLTKKDIYL